MRALRDCKACFREGKLVELPSGCWWRGVESLPLQRMPGPGDTCALRPPPPRVAPYLLNGCSIHVLKLPARSVHTSSSYTLSAGPPRASAGAAVAPSAPPRFSALGTRLDAGRLPRVLPASSLHAPRPPSGAASPRRLLWPQLQNLPSSNTSERPFPGLPIVATSAVTNAPAMGDYGPRGCGS